MAYRKMLLLLTLFVPSAALHNHHVDHDVDVLSTLGSIFKVSEKPGVCTLPQAVNQRLRKVPLGALEERLAAHQPFTWLRWGDGDMFCGMNFGPQGVDSNGFEMESHNEVCKKLRKQVREYGAIDDSNLYVVLGTFFICKELHPDTYQGVGHFLRKEAGAMNPNFDGFVDPFPKGGDQWYVRLYDEHERIQLSQGERPVMTFLRGHVVVLVGPQHLNRLQSALNHTAFIAAEDAGQNLEHIEKQMLVHSTRHPHDNVVFVLAGGVAGRVIGYDMWKKIGHKDTIIDVGSVLDGLAGQKSRDYHLTVHRYCKTVSHYMPERLCKNDF